MDFKQLSYFINVAELGSFTRAEELLSVSQPHLSRQIRLLEGEVQQKLFERNGRGVILTDAGRRLLAHAQTIMLEFERARRELSPETQAMTGEIVVGIPPSVARVLTVPLAIAFRKQLPQARLFIYELLSVQVMEWVSEGRLDLGLVHNARLSAGYEVRHLISEETYLIGPHESDANIAKENVPIRVTELAGYPFVVQSGRQTRRLLIDSDVASAKIEMNIVFEVGSTEAVLDLVKAGLGYATLPLSSLLNRRSEFLLRPIIEPRLDITLSLLSSTRKPMPGIAPAVEEILTAIIMNLFSSYSR